MDFRAALAFLVLIIAPATCASIAQKDSLSETIDFIQKRIRTALHKLDAGEQLLTTSCPSTDVSVPVGPTQQPSPASFLGPFLCYTLKMSMEAPEVSEELLSITQSIEHATNGTAPDKGCTTPEFTEDVDKYEFVQCLLLLLDQRLRKAQINSLSYAQPPAVRR